MPNDITGEAQYQQIIDAVNTAYVRGDPCMLIVATEDMGDDTVTVSTAGVRHTIEKRGLIDCAYDVVGCLDG